MVGFFLRRPYVPTKHPFGTQLFHLSQVTLIVFNTMHRFFDTRVRVVKGSIARLFLILLVISRTIFVLAVPRKRGE